MLIANDRLQIHLKNEMYLWVEVVDWLSNNV
jgi:hypothetical protein